MEKSIFNNMPSAPFAGFHFIPHDQNASHGRYRESDGNQRRNGEAFLDTAQSLSMLCYGATEDNSDAHGGMIARSIANQSCMLENGKLGISDDKQKFLLRFKSFDAPDGKALTVDALVKLAAHFNETNPNAPMRVNGTSQLQSVKQKQSDNAAENGKGQAGFLERMSGNGGGGINCKLMNKGLSKGEALQEIRDISGHGSGISGYFFTSGMTGDSTGHVESLLIDGHDVINIIPFNKSGDNQITEADYPGLYTSDVQQLLKKSEVRARRHIMPQATEGECASLGLSYLKNYLKDDCKQLDAYTVKLSFHDEGSERKFFLPSPWVLRYSQSSLYAKLIHAVVASDDAYHTIEHQKCDVWGREKYIESYTVLTLKGMLEDKGCTWPKNVSLEKFRASWLSAYESAMTKREQMTAAGENQYLIYRSVRDHKKAKALKQPKA